MAKSEEELLASAASHARQTTISWADFLRRVETQANYAYETTQWYAAGADLQALKSLPPVTPPPVTPPTAFGSFQNVVVVSDNPQQALEAPAHYALLFSADPAYCDSWVSVLDRARSQGRQLGVWCDCRTTFPDAAIALMKQYGLEAWSGQAESEAELEVALAASAPLLIGNANAWSQSGRDRVSELIAAGKLSFSQEAYTNCGWPWPEATSSAGVPCASLAIGLYDASGEIAGGRYVSVDEYAAHTPAGVWAGISAYVSGLHPGELVKLP